MPKEQTVVIFTLTLLAVIGPIGPCFQSGCIRSQRIGRYRITDQVDGVASNKLVGAIYAAQTGTAKANVRQTTSAMLKIRCFMGISFQMFLCEGTVSTVSTIST